MVTTCYSGCLTFYYRTTVIAISVTPPHSYVVTYANDNPKKHRTRCVCPESHKDYKGTVSEAFAVARQIIRLDIAQ